MQFPYFSKNGEILPIAQANIPLASIEYSYGFGVYETLKVRNGIIYFVAQHVQRLFTSAQIIGLSHHFTKALVTEYILALVKQLESSHASYNIKMLLIGGSEPQLCIMALAPYFPDRKLYSEGVKTISVHYERLFPKAKTLNMLASYLAYKQAKELGCYEALLINRSGNILEGTRSNFFAIKGNVLLTSPAEDVLEGVTRQTVISVAQKFGFIIHETAISLVQVAEYDGAFLTSTSSKIVPIKQIDDYVLQVPEKLRELMKAYDAFLKESNGIFSA